jgi:glycosyltransferase involved in cell wall biosynthesis
MTTLLSINNYYYYRGGAESVFLEQNKMFEAGGWQVVPFAMNHPKNLPSPWQRFFVDEIEFGEHYSLAQKLTRLPKVIYSFEARQKLSALLDAVKPQIAHGHNIYHHISPSILGLLSQRGIPTVLTLHDLKVACPAYNMLAPDGVCERCKGGHLSNVLRNRCIKGSTALSGVVMLEAVLHRWLGSYAHVDRMIVPSRFYMQKLTEWGMSAERFRHVPNFVDAARFTPDFAGDSHFLYFGRLSREKGIETLIRAIQKAGCALTIVGTGPQKDQLETLAASLSADVTFRGYLTGQSLHDEIRAARAVVLPSEWYENAPMSVLEAYAMGKPVIGARIGGIPEFIREGETGSLFESGNVAALAEVLAAYAGMSPTALESLGRNARHWVETDFTSDLYFLRVNDVYRELGVDMPVSPRQRVMT